MDVTQIGLAALVVRQVHELVVAPLYDNIEFLAAYKWTQIYPAGLLGVLVAYLLELDILSVAGIANPSLVGFVLTGIGLGAGADFIHNWIER